MLQVEHDLRQISTLGVLQLVVLTATLWLPHQLLICWRHSAAAAMADINRSIRTVGRMLGRFGLVSAVEAVRRWREATQVEGRV